MMNNYDQSVQLYTLRKPQTILQFARRYLAHDSVNIPNELQTPAVLVDNQAGPPPVFEDCRRVWSVKPTIQTFDTIVVGKSSDAVVGRYLGSDDCTSYCFAPAASVSRRFDLMAAVRTFSDTVRGVHNHPQYGVDRTGSLFAVDNHQHSWSLRELDSPLSRAAKCEESPFFNIKGLGGYVYHGTKYTCSPDHTEDGDFMSINYLHSGAPKLWKIIPRESYLPTFNALLSDLQGEIYI